MDSFSIYRNDLAKITKSMALNFNKSYS